MDDISHSFHTLCAHTFLVFFFWPGAGCACVLLVHWLVGWSVGRRRSPLTTCVCMCMCVRVRVCVCIRSRASRFNAYRLRFVKGGPRLDSFSSSGATATSPEATNQATLAIVPTLGRLSLLLHISPLFYAHFYRPEPEVQVGKGAICMICNARFNLNYLRWQVGEACRVIV